MSAQEILKELPKLSLEERRRLAREIFALEPDVEVMETATEAADMAFMMLDHLEAEDAAAGER